MWNESKHRRGQPENKGQFGPGGGGAATAERPPRTVGHEHARPTQAVTAAQAKREPAPLRLKPVKDRAYNGVNIETQVTLSKDTTGKVGENIVISYARLTGSTDARYLNLEDNNVAIDLVHDTEAMEVKAGIISSKNKRWVVSLGEPGDKEKEMLAAMSKAEKSAWNEAKRKACIDRKNAKLAELSKELGRPVKASTVTVILNPDTKTADIYKFDGWHLYIGWNSKLAKQSYVATVRYG